MLDLWQIPLWRCDVPLTSKELGQRLKQIREAGQITQEAAAKALGVSRPTIAQIEAGNRPINTVQLEKFARLCGKDIEDLISPPAAQPKEATAVLFRMTQELKQPIDQAALEPRIKLLREYTQLEALLGLNAKFAVPVKHELPDPRSVWEAIDTGQKMAEDERQRLQLGTRPVKDMAELLEVQGVRVLDIEMDEDISGIFMGDPQIGLSIFVNPKHHAFRHAFTLAHEYCHVLADRHRVSVISSGQTEKDLIEVRANAFAAAFLLPKAGVEQFFQSQGKTGPTRITLSTASLREEPGEPAAAEQRRPASATEIQLYDIVHLQHHYGVSWPAAVHRLQNLGIIGKEQRDELLARQEEARQLGHIIKLERKEPESDKRFETRDFRVRFFCLGVDAFRQDLISLQKLQELMAMIDVELDELRQLLVKAKLLKKAAA